VVLTRPESGILYLIFIYTNISKATSKNYKRLHFFMNQGLRVWCFIYCRIYIWQWIPGLLPSCCIKYQYSYFRPYLMFWTITSGNENHHY